MNNYKYYIKNIIKIYNKFIKKAFIKSNSIFQYRCFIELIPQFKFSHVYDICILKMILYILFEFKFNSFKYMFKICKNIIKFFVLYFCLYFNFFIEKLIN